MKDAPGGNPRRRMKLCDLSNRTPESTDGRQGRQLRRVPRLEGHPVTIHIRRGSLPIDNCTLIPTAYARDSRLSLEARGVLAWLMSQPAADEITEEQIIAAGPDGRAAVRLMLGELEECGYLVHEATTYVLTAPSEGEGRA